jgi:hypothetical protein
LAKCFYINSQISISMQKAKNTKQGLWKAFLEDGKIKKVWCKRKIVLISILVMAIYFCHANTWFISDIKRLEGPFHRKWFSRGRERRVNLFFVSIFEEKSCDTIQPNQPSCLNFRPSH